jgi:hypothetical protein
MKKNQEPKLWVTVLKLIVGATLLIGGVGTALWYVDQEQSKDAPTKVDKSWGIFRDSPIRSNR